MFENLTPPEFLPESLSPAQAEDAAISQEGYDQFCRLVEQLPNKRAKYMRTILVQSDDENQTDAARHRLRLLEELRPLFPKDNITCLEERIFILVSSPQAHCPFPADKARAEKILARHQATAVISHTAVSMKALHISYLKNRIILPVIRKVRLEPDTRLAYFGRYNLYLTIHICARNLKNSLGSDDIIYLCSPGILTLTRYDQAYHNNLRDVLFHYLLHDRSIAETSKALYMHRNTTIYKIHKIEELINHSLDDPYYRFHMLFSCMVIRYYEEYQGHKLALSPFIREDYKN